jgi:hypothetical protein
MRGSEMKVKAGQEYMARMETKEKISPRPMSVVDVDWFFSEENLAKLSDEELLFILHDLLEIQKEKRGGQAGGASG